MVSIHSSFRAFSCRQSAEREERAQRREAPPWDAQLADAGKRQPGDNHHGKLQGDVTQLRSRAKPRAGREDDSGDDNDRDKQSTRPRQSRREFGQAKYQAERAQHAEHEPGEGGMKLGLFIAIGSMPVLGDHAPPLLLLAAQFEEAFPPALLKTRTDAPLVISPWSDHLLEGFDPVLVNAAVEAACAAVHIRRHRRLPLHGAGDSLAQCWQCWQRASWQVV